MKNNINKKVYDIIKNNINEYSALINSEQSGNSAIFEIFNSFFNALLDDNDNKIFNRCGVKMITPLANNIMCQSANVNEDSWNKEGISFIIEFDSVLYSIRFKKYRDGQNMYYNIGIKNSTPVKYDGEFIYKYLFYNALDTSKIKGSYFSMPRNRFEWDIKTPEERTFDDIYLPKEVMDDLHLYVDIYKKAGRILRYLMVGNPGVAKTEATLVLARELNKLGVTVIKTPICDKLHEKVELGNVLSPSLLLLDDVDLSLGDRNKGSYSTLMGDFLDVMDGTDKLAKNVGVIATTNAAHLLDLAAQRPGRFDKTLMFDDITKDNIKNIIKKSLRVNFGLIEGEEFNMYTDFRIVDKFYDSAVSGAHIYNAIQMLKLRYDTIEEKNITISKIINSIDQELKVIAKVRKASMIKEKYERGNGSVGFKFENDGVKEEKKYDIDEPNQDDRIDKTREISTGKPYGEKK